MGFFNVGRIIGYFFNQLFRWLFWNKTGQKILFAIVIAIILVVFVMLGEVSAAEPENFANYEEINFDGFLSDRYLSAGSQIVSTPSGSSTYLYYLELNPYNYYSVLTNVNSNNCIVRYGFSNSLNVGSSVYELSNNVNIPVGSSVDSSFSGSNGYRYFVIYCNQNFTPSIYYNPFPYRISTISNVNNLKLSTVEVSYEPGSYHRHVAFPIHEGFTYIIDGLSSTSTPFFYSSNIEQFFANYNIDYKYPASFSGTNISSYMNGTINNNTTTITENHNMLFYYSYFNDSSNRFVAPFDGWLIFDTSDNSTLFKIYSDYSGVDKPTTTTNSNINNVNSSINNLNDSITNPNISEDNNDYTLPESGVTDIAESGFANIFDKLRTAFTQESSGQGLVVQVPFTDKSFTISKNTVFGSANLGIVGTLINSFWYFLVSLWIVKDIAHKMNMIKSGNIELAQTSNIKEDLL